MKLCLHRFFGKRVLAVLACATLAFCACDARPGSLEQQPQPPQSPASASVSAPGETSMANPLVSMPDWRALHNAVDVELAAPPHAENVLYFVLDRNIAQINFTLYGVEYVLRATQSPDDIAGVYGTFTDLGTFPVFSGDDMTTVSASTTSEAAVHRWTWDDEYYTLVGHAPEEDVSQYMALDPAALTQTDGPAVYYPDEPRVGADTARLCAELSSGEGEADELDELMEYPGETRNKHASVQFPQLGIQFMNISQPIPRNECLSASDTKAFQYGLRCTVIDTSGEKITWEEFLRRHESAVLVETTYTSSQGQDVRLGNSHQLMMPGENGSYATIGCIFQA